MKMKRTLTIGAVAFTRLAGAKRLRQFMYLIPDREYYWRKVGS
jgi:hypothetical protein